MTKHCAKCGQEILASESVCAVCGMPVGGQYLVPFTTQWEYCEIREYVIEEVGWFKRAVYALTAVAVGPIGTYNAGEVLYHGGANLEQRSAQALTQLVLKLTKDGWTAIPNNPPYGDSVRWFTQTFTRRVGRPGRKTMS